MSQGRPREDAYDVVVVGAGFGGLSAAACLATAGKKVLAVERQDGPGGYAHVFRRGPYVFDPAVHVTPTGFGGLEFWELYLGALGIEDRVELLTPTPFYGVKLPDLYFEAPVGIEEFTEAHCAAFPDEADGIRRFVELGVQITDETQQLATRLSLADLGKAIEQFPVMFRYRTTPLAEVLDELVGDPHVRAVLAAAWPYLGLPPGRLSFVQFGAMLAAFMEKGPGYCRGSFQSLADGFAAAIVEHGSELLLDTRATQITVEDGRVTGVVLEGDRAVRAPIVVSNADARVTFEELIGLEHFPDALVKRYRRMRPSISALILYSATTLDVSASGLAHETFVYRHWDHEQSYADALEGRLGGTWLSFPTMHDPSLAPEGEHLVIFTSLMAYDAGTPWDEARDRYAELMLAEVESLLPGFREGLTFAEVATPETLERYTLNQRGAIYGWENSPDQSQPKRLAHRPPIEGLFLAGHWTEPGSSSFRVVYSGLQAAQSILGYTNAPELLQTLYAQKV